MPNTLQKVFKGHSPLDDPKQGDFYLKYLGGIKGFNLMNNFKANFLNELSFTDLEVHWLLLHGAEAIIMRDDKPDINPK